MDYSDIMKVALVSFSSHLGAQAAIIGAEKTLFKDSFLSVIALTDEFMQQLKADKARQEEVNEENAKS